MNKTMIRAALCSGVTFALPAIPAAILLAPAQAGAQTVCAAGVPTTTQPITCTNGVTVATGTTDLANTVNPTTDGLSITSPGDQTTTLTITGPFVTSADSAVVLTSAGSITFTGTGAVTTSGAGASGDGYIFTPTTTVNASVGNITTSGPNGYGVRVDSNTGTTLTTGNITTTGGSGARGVVVINSSGPVNVTTGTLNTTGVGISTVGSTGNVTFHTGAITTTGNGYDAVNVDETGNGNVSVTTGAISTNGIGSNGVVINAPVGSTGTVTTNLGSVTTLGDNSAGLLIANGNGNVDAGYGNITTSGTGAASALQITSGGTINLRGAGSTLRTNGANQITAVVEGAGITGNLGNVTAAGAGSQGVVLVSSAPINLTIGNIASTQEGLQVFTGASAPVTLNVGTVSTSESNASGVTINSTGAISYTGGKITTTGATDARGLVINGGAGAISATLAGASTTGGASSAVDITGLGAVTFVNTGSITTTGNASSGIRVNAGTTAAVTCGNVSSTASGTNAVNVTANGNTTVTCGTVSTGPNSTAINVTNSAGTTVVTGGTTTATGASSNGIVVNSSGGAVTVNSGVVNASLTGVSATSSSGAAVNVVANGNVTATAGTGIVTTTTGTGTVTVNSGTTVSGTTAAVQLNSTTNVLNINGTVQNSSTGPAILGTAGAATVNIASSGVLNGRSTFGSGNDVVNNAGTFNASGTTDFGAGTDVFNNSGTVKVVGAPATFANLETFNNNGGLIDLRDNAANDVLTISGNYVASGNARLGVDVDGNGTGTLTADLLNLGTTSGTTNVLLNILPGAIAINTTGVRIVDATGGTGVFTGAANFGLIDYNVVMNGPDAYVQSTPDAAIVTIPVAGQVGQELWYQSADTYNDVAAARRSDFGVERASRVGTFALLYGAEDKTGANATQSVFGTSLASDQRIKTHRRGAQAGLDFHTPMFVVGVTGGWEHARASFRSSAAGIDADGWNYGLYAQYGMARGFYAGGLVKRDSYRLKMVDGVFYNARARGHSTGADGELGYRFGEPILFDLSAGLSYVRSKIDDFTTGNLTFNPGSFTSTRGRLAARATFNTRFAPFIDAKLMHEFKGDSRFDVVSGSTLSSVDAGGRGTWGRIEAGIGGSKGGALLSAWADFGDVKGFGGRAGFRF